MNRRLIDRRIETIEVDHSLYEVVAPDGTLQLHRPGMILAEDGEVVTMAGKLALRLADRRDARLALLGGGMVVMARALAPITREIDIYEIDTGVAMWAAERYPQWRYIVGDFRASLLDNAPYDVIIDDTGGDPWPETEKALARGGVFIHTLRDL